MAHALRIFRASALAEAVLQFVANLRWAIDACPRKQNGNRYPARPLDAAAIRDIGPYEYQDHSSSRGAPVAATRRLHYIADAIRWQLPR